MAAANANLLEPDGKILKDVNDINVDDDDSKANFLEEVNGEIHEAQSSDEPSKTGVGNTEADEMKEHSDEDDKKNQTTPVSTCDDMNMHGNGDTFMGDDDVKEMNEEEAIAMEELISNLHIGELPTMGKKEAKKPVLLLNNLRCRGRSTLLLFYRLWRQHLVKKPPPPM